MSPTVTGLIQENRVLKAENKALKRALGPDKSTVKNVVVQHRKQRGEPIAAAIPDDVPYSVDEAAVYAHSSRSTLYREMRDGKLAYSRLRGQHRIMRSTLLKYLQQTLVAAGVK
jgi:excisionase family DNA binding protein